jgi:hypothetical protein
MEESRKKNKIGSGCKIHVSQIESVQPGKGELPNWGSREDIVIVIKLGYTGCILISVKQKTKSCVCI